ncbi:hypothetical protein G5T42_17210 [Microbacterium sp. 4R-513]|uniref:hypothetical protein n=1 Tax=Microbacterium sp. 4R-513 TaxID=2567934 RepID=UPI0013E13D51|nr:hypothetical protein [Microbacterium sp. 4R-513]QIG40998.1 hypothetical protein G5T42_17210 [Microbacterium sp. 4R-513]
MSTLDSRFAKAFSRVFARAESITVPIDEGRIDLGLLPHDDVPAESLPRVTVFRAQDLAHVGFRFVNLTLTETDDGTRELVRDRPRTPAILVAVFGPQHLLEEAFFDASGDPNAFIEKGAPPDPAGGSEIPHPPVQAILGRESRLAFRVTTERIPYTEAGLLAAMRMLPLNVVPHAESAAWIMNWQLLAERVGGHPKLAPDRLQALRRSAQARRRVQWQPPTSVARGLRAVDASESALADLASHARTVRTASEIEARFGASSAAAAVAVDVGAGIHIGPIYTPALRPPPPRAPLPTETAIELPWRLQLSPHSEGAFAHSLDPVEHDGRVEVWHSRLGTRTEPAADAPADAPWVIETDAGTRTVRAVWTRDFEAPGQEVEGNAGSFPNEDFGDLTTLPPFRASLSVRDRMQLVHLTSNHHWPGRSRSWSPAPVPVEHLMLTGLGGWLSGEVHFPDPIPPMLTIEQWRHHTTMGRDQFVEVVYQGVLLPFGHRASLVKVTERRVKGDGFATLYQRLFVVVRQPERRYLSSGSATFDNAMPFRWVRITTASTPPLALPKKLEPLAEGQIFVPEIATSENVDPGGPPPAGQVPFRFRMLANDVDNHLVEFEGPLVFVEKSAFETARSTRQLARLAANAALPPYDMSGQRIAFAPPGDPDDTTLATASIAFDALFDTVTPDRSRNFVLPVMRVATAPVPAMSAFTGQSAPQALRYADAYRTHAFGGAGKNEGELFLELAKPDGTPSATPSTMGFASQADRSGGFVSPSVDVKALARRVGPVGGDLAKLATNRTTFDVGGMFGLDAAKLFGILPLAELLPSQNSPLPTFVTKSVTAAVGLQQAVGEARAFVTRETAALTAMGAAAQNAANDIASRASAFADAIVLLSQPPHADPGLEAILDELHTAIVTLQSELEKPGLPFPRPTLERIRALLTRLADATGTADELAGLILQFYRGAQLPESISARLEWETALEPWPSPASPIFAPKGDRMLRLSSEVQAPLRGSTPTALVSCALPPFDLVLMGDVEFIIISVTVMEFSVQPGRKPDVNVELDGDDGIRFAGPLAFVETLKDLIPFDGFSDPPYLDISTSGLKTGFDLAIPDFAVGVFALTNIHLGAELVVPFIGESLEFRFFFATRENPFRLQVAFFAGGGFFAITISPKGLKVVEAAFEFGAAVQMSFVVASGSLSVMAGIYFRLEVTAATSSVELTGYFRARGEVDVLGLISACIELYLELSYRSIGGSSKAVGKASISIEVSVCFLSFSVSVSCEKQFAGSSGDPTFIDMMADYTDADQARHHPWAEYCDAFAVEAV